MKNAKTTVLPTLELYTDQLAKLSNSLNCNASVKTEDQQLVQDIVQALAAGRKIKVHERLDLEKELAKFENLPLECDGLSRVLTYKLREFKIKHRLMVGHFTVDGQKAVPIHWWIEVADGTTVDYRARMWGGSHPHIPHGVFLKKSFERVVYVGEENNVKVSTQVFKALTMELVEKKAG